MGPEISEVFRNSRQLVVGQLPPGGEGGRGGWGCEGRWLASPAILKTRKQPNRKQN